MTPVVIPTEVIVLAVTKILCRLSQILGCIRKYFPNYEETTFRGLTPGIYSQIVLICSYTDHVQHN